jgi:hypothetical protein
VERSTLRVGIAAANGGIAAGVVGVVAWAVWLGVRGWRGELDAVIVAALVIAGTGWLVSVWARLRLSR